jgi:hypothetical protein
MATLTKGKTFTNGELVTPQKLHELVDFGSVSNIVNADIAAGAAIADTKLAQITTAGKVANSATTATNASTANAIVARDGSGNFSAGTITANLTGNVTGNASTATTATTAAACSGNAATATTLQTARTINGVSFNGSANITVTATPDAHTHDDRYYTESEMNTLLAGKQASGSYAPATGIAQSAVANLTTDLAGKAAASHNHGNITNAGAIGTTASLPIITGANGILQAGSFGTTAGTFCQGNDSRLSNLNNATSSNTAGAIVQRSGTGGFEANSILLRNSPTNYTSIGLYPSVSNDMQGFALIEISHINKTNDPFLNFVFNGSIIGSIKSNSSSSVSYNTTSDYRLKTNIEPLTAAVARLLQIPARRFNWLADPTAPKVDGFLAHEAQAVVPEAVTGTKDAVDADGKPIYQGIDQSKLVPLLVAAVQELSARVAALEAK